MSASTSSSAARTGSTSMMVAMVHSAISLLSASSAATEVRPTALPSTNSTPDETSWTSAMSGLATKTEATGTSSRNSRLWEVGMDSKGGASVAGAWSSATVTGMLGAVTGGGRYTRFHFCLGRLCLFSPPGRGGRRPGWVCFRRVGCRWQFGVLCCGRFLVRVRW